MTSPRIVITGLGIVSPFGIGTDCFREGIARGVPSVRTGGGPDAAVPNFAPAEFDAGYKFLRLPRVTQFSVIATDLALRNASLECGLGWEERTGIFAGTTHGVMEQLERFYDVMFDKGPQYANPLLFQNTVPNVIASEISLRWGFKACAFTITSGSASGILALTMARDWLKTGRAQLAVVVAGEELSSTMIDAYRRLRLVKSRRHGDDLTLGEGAGALVLERLDSAVSRGVPILAEVLGSGAAHDADRMLAHDCEGRGLERAMKMALEDGALDFREVEYLAAASNGSRILDRSESEAVRRLVGNGRQTLQVARIKRQIGESFSAGALFNVAACVTTLQGHPGGTGFAMANSASFGGNCASVLLGNGEQANDKR